eukprot:m.591851 g.591851  ORF g.591851 m.591851 type:complete len:750 (-) comp22386_c0_seq7:1804-4053(-)
MFSSAKRGLSANTGRFLYISTSLRHRGNLRHWEQRSFSAWLQKLYVVRSGASTGDFSALRPDCFRKHNIGRCVVPNAPLRKAIGFTTPISLGSSQKTQVETISKFTLIARMSSSATKTSGASVQDSEVEFPVFASPQIDDADGGKIDIEKFLYRLQGPPNQGLESDSDQAFQGKMVAIDVRSPGEYEKGHIPGAINVPLFSNDERAVVGTDFNQRGRYTAIKTGLGIIGPKLQVIVHAVEQAGVEAGGHVLVYCWRGGMRSGSVAWLLRLCGFQVNTLDGGYRSYRRWCRALIGEDAAHTLPPCRVMVLGGCTGVGKTDILLHLRAQGEQVIDLEGVAHHRGSAFGAIGQQPQPANEEYENRLAMAVRSLAPDRPVWFEHEGGHVGHCIVPKAIQNWVQMAPRGHFVVVRMEKQHRVARLVQDYCNADQLRQEGWADGIKQCISARKGGLAKRLGGERVAAAIAHADAGEWDHVCGMMLDYYDRLYKQWQDDTKSSSVSFVEAPSGDAEANARLVLQSGRAGLAAVVAMEMSGGATPSLSSDVTTRSMVSDAPDGAAAPVPIHKGTCHCGEVCITTYSAPRTVSCCHCSVCRRLSGAPFTCQALYPTTAVQVVLEPGASLVTHKTSRAVERKRCGTCLSPVYATLFNGKLTAVPVPLLGTWKGFPRVGSSSGEADDNMLRPLHHLYYADRVMDVLDGLPKYAKGARPMGQKPGALAKVLGDAPGGGDAPATPSVPAVALTGKTIPEQDP